MREYSVRNLSLGAADGPPVDDGLTLAPPPFHGAASADDDALRLDLDRQPDARPRRPVRKGPPRGLILAGWAGALSVALGVAYFTQPGRTLGDDVDPPPQVAPPADALGEPVTAPSIASDPSHFTQAATAPEVAPAAPEAPEGEGGQPTGDPQIAAATPAVQAPADAALAKAFESAPNLEKAKAVEPPAAKSAAAKPAKSKVQKISSDADDEPATKASPHKPARASDDGKDLPQLKARMNRAYAQAVKAGMPKSVLKARQAEWAVLRAKAEKKGPAAVNALYRARAAQLEALTKKAQDHAHART